MENLFFFAKDFYFAATQPHVVGNQANVVRTIMQRFLHSCSYDLVQIVCFHYLKLQSVAPLNFMVYVRFSAPELPLFSKLSHLAAAMAFCGKDLLHNLPKLMSVDMK